MRHCLIVAAVVAAFAGAVHADVYEIDPAHTTVGFKVRHVVTKLPGRFTKVSGTINYDPAKPESWSVVAKIDPASVNTDNEKRDNHLRTPDFFDVAKCPEMAFKSTKVTDVKDGKTATLHGDLTMRCVTKPVDLQLEIAGVETDKAFGAVHAGFSATTTIKRSDWGVSFGPAIVGDEVQIEIDVEAAPAKTAKPAAKAKK